MPFRYILPENKTPPPPGQIMTRKLFSHCLAHIGSFFAVVLGRLNWTSPPWINYLRRQATTRPKSFLVTTISALMLLTIVGYGYYWYKNQPHPQLITASITAPDITPIKEDKLVPHVLTINFGFKPSEGNNDWFRLQSVAPLELIGKTVTHGITLSPEVKGQWRWDNDHRLIFTPENDWPAGQTYSVHFATDVFTANTHMQQYTYSFATHPFEAKISAFSFYQDPIQATHRQAVATIDFNFPVDTNSLESNTSLLFQALKYGKLDLSAKHYTFHFTYDKYKRTAYLHSELLSLPKISRYLLLTINKGVKSATGSAKTQQAVTQNLLIPNMRHYFKILSATASIIHNDKDRPEQVFVLESSLGVQETELKKHLHVYLLPQHYPATATEEEKKDYAWQNPGEVNAAILALSTPLSLKTIPAEHNYATLHSYQFTAPTPRSIYLKIDKGARGFGNVVLTHDYVAVIKVPEFPQEINFLHKGALLAFSGEKKLSVLARGLSAVQFEFARVLPDNVNQLVTQTQGDFNNPSFINKSFNQYNISEIFSEIQQFDSTDSAQQHYTALDFNKYLSAANNTAGPHGLFLLQARGWDVEKKLPLDVYANRLVLITDLGLIVKDNQDGSHDVFVQSITEGTPQANVKVSVLGKNGLPILTQTTDEHGRANFPILTGYIDEQEPVAYLASIGSDVSFIPYNNANRQLNYSRYDVGGVYNNQEEHQLSAYLFSDRGIYRPGDTAHLAMIVKQTYVEPQPTGLPLEVTVTDPRGVIIQDSTLTLDTLGYLSLDVPTNPASPTGQYLVNLYLVKDKLEKNNLGSTTFQVAEFQPDRMRIRSSLSQEPTDGWISPLDLSSNVQLWNLYGAPATNRIIHGRILLEPKRVAFKKYPDYHFADPLFDPKKPAKVFTDTLPEMKTNDKGQATFKLNLERFDNVTAQLTFFAEGFEAGGGRSVATQTRALVSPLSSFVGFKSDGDLNYIQQNGQRHVHFIAVNPQLNQIEIKQLHLQLLALRPISTLVKKPDGTYQYQSIIQRKILSTTPFTISSQGTDFTLPTATIGDFAVIILDKNNSELSHLHFSVVGASQQPLAQNAELNVKLNQETYHAGDDIELQITAPYTGAGLITIERDKVYSSQWFKSSTTSSVQTIHIPNDFQGNGYVNVTFVRDWNSPDIFISPLSYNVVPFEVSHENHTIHIDLKTPALARPGEPFTIDYHSDKPGKIIVFAVDEGILQVASYQTPDPLAFFFQKRALEVLTQQTVDQILPQYIRERELSAVGGDGSAYLLAARLNPFKRKTDLPVAYWSGIVDTDSTSRQLTYNVPDYYNGTLHVMAVAVALDAVGAADKKSEVRGHFVISPNTPMFVAPGDEFEITASIANNVKNSGENAPVSAQLEVSSELEIIGSATQSLHITEGQEQTAHFKLRALTQLGSATMTFVASIGEQSSRLDTTLSVRPASAFSTTVTSGYSQDTQQSLAITRTLYPEYRTVEAVMSSSPLILVTGLQRYLDYFPYGCTEQLTSKAFPLLAIAGSPWLSIDPKSVTKKIMTTIQMLGQRQMSNGGFSYWPGVGENTGNTLASVYAMHFLTDAHEQGYKGPNEMFNAGLNYLKELGSQNATSMEMARIQAYAIYVLTRNEIVTTNYLTNLQLYLDKNQPKVWQQDLTGAYIAATYALLQNKTAANQLITQYKTPTQAEVTSDFYSSNLANAQYLYLVARHFPDRLAAMGDKLVMQLITAINSGEINTLLSAYTSLALNAYAQTETATGDSHFSIGELLAGNQQRTIAAFDTSYGKAAVGDKALQIIYHNPKQQPYFYQLIQAGFDTTQPTTIIQQGLEINRDYRDHDGKTIDTTTLGSEIEVHIQVRALDNRNVNNTAIVDLLPGGFEVVRDSVKALPMDYADAREDRVVFFGYVGTSTKEIIYRIKAINTGKFTVPSIIAESMYDPNIKARGEPGSMTVTNALTTEKNEY